jgi:ornithine carbamoyltransferase
MDAPTNFLSIATAGSLPAEACALAQRARAFRQAAADGQLPPLLQGRRLGVLYDVQAAAEAMLVHQSAVALGAHVSLVHPGFDEASDGAAMIHTARTLGRLYDVVACVALSPVLVRQLRAAAPIPVLDEACLAAVAAVTTLLGVTAPHADDDERRALWQAMLAASLG